VAPPSDPAPARRASYSEGAGFGALSFVTLAVLGIGTAIAIARVYGIEAIGEYALVMAPVNAVGYLSSARERPAFIRELTKQSPREPRVTALFYAMFSFSAVLTLVVGAIGLAITALVFEGPIDRPGLFVPAAVSVAGYALLTNTGWNLDAVFSAFIAGRDLFWIRLHQAVVFVVIAVAVSAWLDDVWGLVAATLASSATSLVHRLASVRRYMRARVGRAELRSAFRTLPELIVFGLKIVPGSIATGVSNEAGTWVLGAVGSVSSVGAYNRAWVLGRRLIDVNWRLTEMLFPTLVDRRHRDDRAGFDRALVDTVRYCAAGLLLPAAAGGGAATGVMALFGPGFSAASDALALILLIPAFLTVTMVLRSALVAADRPLLTSGIAIVRMVVTVAAIAALTSPMGITGTALGLLAGATAELIWISIVTARQLSAPLTSLWPARQLAALVIATGAGFGAARAVDEALGGVLGTLLALTAGSIVYCALLLVAGGIGERDRERLRAVAARLRRGRAGRASYST
jgi:O-antigen/teichoic acid export membrane protein